MAHRSMEIEASLMRWWTRRERQRGGLSITITVTAL
jgi:hypothetical protein